MLVLGHIPVLFGQLSDHLGIGTPRQKQIENGLTQTPHRLAVGKYF